MEKAYLQKIFYNNSIKFCEQSKIAKTFLAYTEIIKLLLMDQNYQIMPSELILARYH